MIFNSTSPNDDFPVGADIEEILQPFADGFPEIAERLIKELPNSTAYLRVEQVLLEAIRQKLAEKDQKAQVALHEIQAKLNKSQQEVAQITKVLEEQETFHKRNQADKDAEIQSLKDFIEEKSKVVLSE